MRVVQLITQARGGPVDHAVDVANELARTGHESHLIGPDGAWSTAAAAAGTAVHRVDVATRIDLAGGRALAGLLASIRPDVVHLQDRRAGLVGRVVALRSGVPTTYTLHGVPDTLAGLVPGNAAFRAPSRRDRVDNLLIERALARAPRSRVVTPCRALADYAHQHVRIPRRRVSAVHNGVSAAWLQPGPTESGLVRPGRVTAMWLGVMQPVKRVPELVRASAAVTGLDLVLVGDGPERAAIQAAVEEFSDSQRVRLLGFRDDPAPVLRAADIVVLPSAAEACPMALLQAMASGLPVVASRAGGIPEIVRDGVDGLLVDTADDHQLTQALQELVDDPALRERLGASARQRVADEFTISHCVEGLLDVYAEVAR